MSENKSITVRIREGITTKFSSQEVDRILRNNKKRCGCCGLRQTRRIEDREMKCYQVDAKTFAAYEAHGMPYRRMARVIEMEAGYCPVCGIKMRK